MKNYFNFFICQRFNSSIFDENIYHTQEIAPFKKDNDPISAESAAQILFLTC